MRSKTFLRFGKSAALILVGLMFVVGCRRAKDEVAIEEIVISQPGAGGEVVEAVEAVEAIVGGAAFDAFVNSAPVTLVDFTAVWCGPCQKLAPILEKMAVSYAKDGVKFGKADVDANKELADRFGITGVPTVYIYVHGKRFAETNGANAQKIMMNLEAAIDEAKKPVENTQAVEEPAPFAEAPAAAPAETPAAAPAEAPAAAPAEAPAAAPAEAPAAAPAEAPAAAPAEAVPAP